MMRVVLDINVLLVSIPVQSRYRLIFDALKEGRYQLLLSNEIVEEYEEKIAEKTTRPDIAANVIRLLLNLTNVEQISRIYFKWNLIAHDPDDNKYTDCAVAGNATMIVSNDKDFNVLNTIEFPKIKVMNGDSFLELLKVDSTAALTP
jgi:putative PIN family toxin of toxin-antitoxin system